jgi:DNA-binding transcriptional LysR family regulator
VVTAVAQGVGCGSKPCFAGDCHPMLERLPGTREETDVQIWLLTHPDLRRSARVRACLQFFGARLSAESARLLGRPEPGIAAAA